MNIHGKYNLNFMLLGTQVGGLERFTALDKAMYGKISGVTDKVIYTNSFHVPENVDISVDEKLKIESKYHKYTNAGHISIIEVENIDKNEVERIVNIMKEEEIGYGKIRGI